MTNLAPSSCLIEPADQPGDSFMGRIRVGVDAILSNLWSSSKGPRSIKPNKGKQKLE